MTKKRKTLRNFIACILTAVMLLTFVPAFNPATLAANVTEQPDLRLQTILIDNWGSVWKTESWGGANLTPNMNWTTLTIRDYYENGLLNFEVRNTGTGDKNFTIGLRSKRHGGDDTINWTTATAGKALTATTDWQSFSLSIKAVVDANPNSKFSLDDLWYVAVSGANGGKPLEFRNVSISSTDDERQYPMIKVNQAGYELNGAKTARVSYFSKFGSLNGKTFEVVNAADGKVVFSGTLSNANSNDGASGERVHIFNFDSVTVPGEYYIRIPNSGLDPAKRSPRDIYEGLNVETIESVKFKIEENVYKSLITDLIRYFYFQRQGIDLEEKYAGDFARKNLHPNDNAVMKWSDRNNKDAKPYDVSQGWYDAGDYGKYMSPAASSVSDLLFAYELFPDVFKDLELNIPETDKDNPRYVDAPGILSEIKWELDMILKFEHSSKDGSFFIAANYDGNKIYMEDTLKKSSNEKSKENERDLRSHQATAGAAAVLAHAYLVYKDVPAYAKFADECLATAIRAWKWVTDSNNPKNMKIDAANRVYEINEADLDREMFWAAGALYRAVKTSGGDPGIYDKYIQDNYKNSNVLRCFDGYQSVNYNHGGKSFLGYVHYLYGNDKANEEVKNKFTGSSGFTSWRNIMLGTNTWGAAYPTWGYWWGSNQMIAQGSMTLLLGSMIIEGNDNLPANVIGNIENTAHHLLGINPMSFSYVSGSGENSVKNIFSAIYSHDKRLDPYKTPPGYFTEGLNIYDNRHLSKFDGKCYIDSDGEWTTNENTIYGNAAMTFLIAAVMAKSVALEIQETKPESVKPVENATVAAGNITPTDNDLALSTLNVTEAEKSNSGGGGLTVPIQTGIIALAVILILGMIVISALIINKNKNKKAQ